MNVLFTTLSYESWSLSFCNLSYNMIYLSTYFIELWNFWKRMKWSYPSYLKQSIISHSKSLLHFTMSNLLITLKWSPSNELTVAQIEIPLIILLALMCYFMITLPQLFNSNTRLAEFFGMRQNFTPTPLDIWNIWKSIQTVLQSQMNIISHLKSLMPLVDLSQQFSINSVPILTQMARFCCLYQFLGNVFRLPNLSFFIL
jgi:hypothetical protein